MAPNPSPSENRITDPSLLEAQDYPNLTGRVARADNSYAAHTGGYSDVYIGYFIEDPSFKVAIKVLRTSEDQEQIETIRRWLNREAKVWHSLKHKNVLPFLGLASGFGRFERCPALIAPYCVNGTVADYVRRSDISESTRVLLVLDVARGLKYLHEQGVVHGDLKPSNVLMSDKKEPLVCDFGRSLILDMRGFTTRPAGTARYQAPELLAGDDVAPNKSADVCAFALTAFEIWTGVCPFSECRNDRGIIMQVLMAKAQPHLPNPTPAMADMIWPILFPCFDHMPEKRPTMVTLVEQLETCI
ncbi:hypothetical protein NP233_g3388 [Leucocoprinus birnbaumii]|uniref:Protein kinase domain-containing protein n=1 Tax=Leucocoprinus birnbaumii TaxID=56174 RepID=A0AAD5VWK4_9AGAR|nr:hypothetical protein NP233_g3388 [Leucocoprinus birnbaumii]